MTAAQPSPGVQGPVAATRRFIAGRTPNPGHRQDVLDGDYDNTEWFAHVQAALTTQPSPGGQGDALDLDRVLSLADVHAEESREDGVRLLDRGGLLAFAQDVAAALAARQPVGEPVCADCGTQVLFECTGCSRSNYPTYMQGAIGEIVYSGEGGLQIEFYDGKPLAPMKLYAAPPAQAVDLGQFRDSVVQAISNVSFMTGYGPAYEKLTELLTLIDKEAGK